jgi:hypothetical protein
MLNVMVLTNTQVHEVAITEFIRSVSLKKPAVESRPVIKATPATNSKFRFTTSNFDDGWVSTEREDWV